MDILKKRAEYCSRIICSTFRDQSIIADMILLELKDEGKCISDLIKGLKKFKKENNEISKIAKKANKKIKELEEKASNEIAEIISPAESEDKSE